MGALRFKLDPEGEFLDNNKDYAAPPWSTIRDLEYASMELEKNLEQDTPTCLNWFNLLLLQVHPWEAPGLKQGLQVWIVDYGLENFPGKNILLVRGVGEW